MISGGINRVKMQYLQNQTSPILRVGLDWPSSGEMSMTRRSRDTSPFFPSIIQDSLARIDNQKH